MWVDTCVLITDDKAKLRIRDDQRGKIIQLNQALDHFTDPKRIPVQVTNIEKLQDPICEALFGTRPSKKTKQIGRAPPKAAEEAFDASHRLHLVLRGLSELTLTTTGPANPIECFSVVKFFHSWIFVL